MFSRTPESDHVRPSLLGPLLGFLMVLSASAQSQPIDFSARLSLEARGFWQSPAFAGQEQGGTASIAFEPEWRWRSEDRSQRASVVLFGRYDEQDSDRSHGDVREMYWAWEADEWDVLIGVNKVFWGVTESRHLIDVINQTDLVEDPDQEQKLGQPMVNLNLQRDWGRIGLYWLPYFRERTFPGSSGRFRPPLPIDTDRADYESSAGQTHQDFAVRYSHYVGDIDLGVYVFRGTDREPMLLASPGSDVLTPYYQQMNQLGVDVQYTVDAWLWKLEAIYRDTATDRFGATVAGFEYTYYQLAGSALDMGALVEYQFDDRGLASPSTIADNDMFAGARLAFNDAADTAILAGITVDLDDGATVFNLEAERRLNDALLGSLRLRTFAGAEPTNPAFALQQDDYLQLQLDWRF